MQQYGFSFLHPQNFTAMNRGDMFVPEGRVTSPVGLAALATPYMGRPMSVHAVPVTYAAPTNTVRSHGAIGMATPKASVT